MKLTDEKIEQAMKYMEMWRHQEEWTDINAALDNGDDLYAAYLLCNSGAIDSNNIKKNGAEFFKETAHETELIIEELNRRYNKLSSKKQSKHVTELFKNCFISDCKKCNHVSFLDSGNEELYPEVKTVCWNCKSKNIETGYGIEMEQREEFDPTPYCNACKAKKKKYCKCGPIADNE